MAAMKALEPVTLLLGADFNWARAGDHLALEITDAGHAKLAAAGYDRVMPVSVDVFGTALGPAPWVVIAPDTIPES
jgi:hypothetical protein